MVGCCCGLCVAALETAVRARRPRGERASVTMRRTPSPALGKPCPHTRQRVRRMATGEKVQRCESCGYIIAVFDEDTHPFDRTGGEAA
jgi:hypothetical protein